MHKGQSVVGMAAISEKQLGEAEKKFRKYDAMIQSMTKEERENPDLLAVSSSRRRRIARGSGHKESEVAELVATFTGMRAQMGHFSKMMKLSGGMAGANIRTGLYLLTIHANADVSCW